MLIPDSFLFFNFPSNTDCFQPCFPPATKSLAQKQSRVVKMIFHLRLPFYFSSILSTIWQLSSRWHTNCTSLLSIVIINDMEQGRSYPHTHMTKMPVYERIKMHSRHSYTKMGNLYFVNTRIVEEEEEEGKLGESKMGKLQ